MTGASPAISLECLRAQPLLRVAGTSPAIFHILSVQAFNTWSVHVLSMPICPSSKMVQFGTCGLCLSSVPLCSCVFPKVCLSSSFLVSVVAFLHPPSAFPFHHHITLSLPHRQHVCYVTFLHLPPRSWSAHLLFLGVVRHFVHSHSWAQTSS